MDRCASFYFIRNRIHNTFALCAATSFVVGNKKKVGKEGNVIKRGMSLALPAARTVHPPPLPRSCWQLLKPNTSKKAQAKKWAAVNQRENVDYCAI
jgi:hypothetical protein